MLEFTIRRLRHWRSRSVRLSRRTRRFSTFNSLADRYYKGGSTKFGILDRDGRRLEVRGAPAVVLLRAREFPEKLTATFFSKEPKRLDLGSLWAAELDPLQSRVFPINPLGALYVAGRPRTANPKPPSRLPRRGRIVHARHGMPDFEWCPYTGSCTWYRSIQGALIMAHLWTALPCATH